MGEGENYMVLVLIWMLMVGDGLHNILSFEGSYLEKLTTTPPPNLRIPGPGLLSLTKIESGPREKLKRFKQGICDSCNVVVCIITSDESHGFCNRKLRELFGDIFSGPEGYDGQSLREKSEIWGSTFGEELELIEYPGLRLVRGKTSFTDYGCRFTHAVSGEKIFMSVSGEYLYDDETGEIIGGVCWCKDMLEYSEYMKEEQKRMFQSHETVCNLVPHLIWIDIKLRGV